MRPRGWTETQSILAGRTGLDRLGMPPLRKTKNNLVWVTGKRPKAMVRCRGYASEDPLTPSGLIGPVRLVFGRDAVE